MIHTHPLDDKISVTPLRGRSVLHGRVGFALALVLCLSSNRLQAQFNGPPSGPGPEINRPFALTTDPAILHPPIHESPLEPGDILSVKLYGDIDYSYGGIRIGTTGDAAMPLAGSLHFGGLTTEQASQLLSQKLDSAGMYHNPAISLTSVDGPNQLINVVGEVRGSVPSIGNHYLLETLSTVGGLPPTASHVITINRRGLSQPIIVDVGNDPLNTRENDIPVFAGDTLIVSRIGIVYVVGAFKSTGVVPLNSYGPLTMTELSALSGGVQVTAKYNDLRIIRTIGNRRTVSVFNIKDILNGKAPDPILEPNDIVFLVPSPLKSFFLGGTLATVLSFASLAISLESIR